MKAAPIRRFVERTRKRLTHITVRRSLLTFTATASLGPQVHSENSQSSGNDIGHENVQIVSAEIRNEEFGLELVGEDACTINGSNLSISRGGHCTQTNYGSSVSLDDDHLKPRNGTDDAGDALSTSRIDSALRAKSLGAGQYRNDSGHGAANASSSKSICLPGDNVNTSKPALHSCGLGGEINLSGTMNNSCAKHSVAASSGALSSQQSLGMAFAAAAGDSSHTSSADIEVVLAQFDMPLGDVACDVSSGGDLSGEERSGTADPGSVPLVVSRASQISSAAEITGEQLKTEGGHRAKAKSWVQLITEWRPLRRARRLLQRVAVRYGLTARPYGSRRPAPLVKRAPPSAWMFQSVRQRSSGAAPVQATPVELCIESATAPHATVCSGNLMGQWKWCRPGGER